MDDLDLRVKVKDVAFGTLLSDFYIKKWHGHKLPKLMNGKYPILQLLDSKVTMFVYMYALNITSSETILNLLNSESIILQNPIYVGIYVCM